MVKSNTLSNFTAIEHIYSFSSNFSQLFVSKLVYFSQWHNNNNAWHLKILTIEPNKKLYTKLSHKK